MNTPYPFSQWTLEAESLKKLPQQDIINILRALPLYDEAIKYNKRRVNKTLKIPQLVSEILETNHPRAQALYDFVTKNNENKEWYIKNKDSIKLIEEWWEFFIEILWDKFYLENEKTSDWSKIYNSRKNNFSNDKYTYFHFDSAQEYAKSQWKLIPEDWFKYVNFLPWDDENKANFLLKVLLLECNGYLHFRQCQVFHSWETGGCYLTSVPYDRWTKVFYFDDEDISPWIWDSWAVGFSLRCIKK